MPIRYKAGYKYQLAADASFTTQIHPLDDIKTEYIELTEHGFLTIKAGYCWDGPSGPTLDTKSFMRGSLAHDALYQLMRENEISHSVNRKRADRLLRELCIEDGMWRIRAAWVYRGVRVGAGGAARNGRKTLEAP